MTNLAAFIVEAHRNGYATTQADPGPDGEKVITYGRGEYGYRDQYYGSTAFVGHEVVTRDGRPVWGMSYYGDVVREDADPNDVYAVLREALEQATTDRPYRGPAAYEGDEMTYSSSVDGDLQRFEGEEHIQNSETVVYRGTFAGGRVD
ncbi:DUF5680 domain-containing protein [Natronobacterium texcoconense]|uniref:DUF5680 domain-containing protein n=1 Tax=Natronobacterium texcoconense TaxID=1095778 RepID=A0A1H1IC84_NATTX|nr:DUF5680 domain-containing protein [Natronobacterium texcoconense]SDR35291.1 hypothetical protein SAMN04489842_3420 [Natronobacterium texcoconense]